MNKEQTIQKIQSLREEEKDLSNKLDALKQERSAYEDSLGFDTGTHAVGDFIVDVKPTVRFDAATAKANLDKKYYDAICESKPSSALAKKILTGYEYENCQKVVGTRITIKSAYSE